MKGLLLFTALVLSACSSKDLFYTARPDIHVTIYPSCEIHRNLRHFTNAQYLNYYSDDDLHRIIENAMGYWVDSLGYNLHLKYGNPTEDDSSDYVIRITKYELSEQKYNRQVSQPATTNSPKMSATVHVRQMNVSFSAVVHSNVDGTDEVITSSESRNENITAGYFQNTTSIFNSSTTPTYKYICDIIPMPVSISENVSEDAMNMLVRRMDHKIHKDYKHKLKVEKSRQKKLMRGATK